MCKIKDAIIGGEMPITCTFSEQIEIKKVALLENEEEIKFLPTGWSENIINAIIWGKEKHV